MKFDVSVIVPLYNDEELIRVCVDSILNQTLDQVEVVIVDDCSSDHSLDVCRESYGENERVQIIRQPKNGGPGAARNRGIREARGEYVAFLDSDDEMMPENLRLMFEAAKEYDADVLHNNMMKTVLPPEDGSDPLELLDQEDSLVTFRLDLGEPIQDIQVLPADLKERLDRWKAGHIHTSICNKMIRRSFILDNDLLFPDMKLAEDAMFCLQCLLTAKNYVLMPGGWYVYRLRTTSFSRGGSIAEGVIKGIQAQLKALDNLRRLSERIPALQDKENYRTAVDTILTGIEFYSVRPGFQAIEEESLRTNEHFSAFFREQFGQDAPYVEFLFFQLHETYPKLPKLFIAEPEEWKKIRQALKEAKSAGKEYIIERS